MKLRKRLKNGWEVCKETWLSLTAKRWIVLYGVQDKRIEWNSFKKRLLTVGQRRNRRINKTQKIQEKEVIRLHPLKNKNGKLLEHVYLKIICTYVCYCYFVNQYFKFIFYQLILSKDMQKNQNIQTGSKISAIKSKIKSVIRKAQDTFYDTT